MNLRSLKTLLVLLTVALSVLPALPALARGLTLDVVNGVLSAIPITVVPFSIESSAQPPATNVAGVIREDMKRCGQFRTLTKADIVEQPTRGSQINFSIWKLLKQDYLVIGRESDVGGGHMKVSFELWNVTSQKRMLTGAYTALPEGLRGVGHRIADQIYQAITGKPGAFYTHIAYVRTTGRGRSKQWSLVVADSDGYHAQVVVRSHQPLMSPAWSPNGKELAYVSFESGDSAIYIQNLATGQRWLVSGRKDINSAPSFSPHGRRLAMTLSFAGAPEIYVENLATHQLTQVTHNPSINTEAHWMPDEKTLVFTSGRSGRPQLYIEPLTGGGAKRLTFRGKSNADAAISDDGNQIAMMQGYGDDLRIAILNRKLHDSYRFISPGPLDESPSFAPDGSMLLYASTDRNGHGVLYEVSDHGSVRQRLSLVKGGVQSPTWGPYRILPTISRRQ